MKHESRIREKTNWKKIYALLAIALLAGSLGYYYIAIFPDNKKNREIGQPEFHQITKTISIGTVSDDAVKRIKRFQPTADYIAAKLSDNETRYEGKVIITGTIDNVTELLKEQKLDLYVESPFATVLVARKSGAVPFLRRWRNGVPVYHTVFFVRNDSSINTLNDFTGKNIVFEDPGSTTSYFLPKAYLIQKGFNLSFFNESQPAGKNNITYIFSEADENTPLWVIAEKADIGVSSNLEFEALQEPIKAKLRIIDRTGDVPRQVVSHRSEMDPVLVEKIKQILLNMDRDKEGIEILKDFQGTKKYDKISKDEVFNASKMLDLLG